MTRSFPFIILLVPRGTVVVVLGGGGGGGVHIVINFLPVASEMIKLLILLAVPAVLAVILQVLPAVLAVLLLVLLVLLVLLTSRSFRWKHFEFLWDSLIETALSVSLPLVVLKLYRSRQECHPRQGVCQKADVKWLSLIL